MTRLRRAHAPDTQITAALAALVVMAALLLSGLAAVIGAPAAAAEDLVDQQIWAKNADVTWNTLRDGTEQGTAWRQLGFDASSWDEVVFRDYTSHGGVPDGGTRGYYYRKEFEITDVWQINAIKAQLYYDDAAVMYLNGQEVYRTIRNNLPDDAELSIIQTIPFGGAENYYVKIPANSNTCETGCVNGGATSPIDSSLLVEGTNVIGLMVWTTPGSDLGVDLALTVVRDLDALPPGPEIAVVDPQESMLADDVSLQLSATTLNDPPITWAANDLPDGLTIDTDSGLITGSPTTIAETTVTAIATDNVGSTQIEFAWTVVNAPPQLTSPGAQQSPSFNPVNLQIEAVDPDGGDLVYAIEGLPPGLSMNETGLITGSSSAEDAYTVTVTVTDDEDAAEMVSFPWQIAEPPITIDNPGAQEDRYGVAASLQLSATDPAGGNVVLTVDDLPPGLTFNANNKRVTGTPTVVGEYTVIVSGTGPSGSSVISFTWLVPNELPVIVVPPNQLALAQIGVVPQLSSASDPDGGPVTLSAMGMPAGLTFDPEIGTFAGAATEDGTFTLTVTATDDEGESSEREFIWQVLPAVDEPVVINEIVASNDASLADEDGSHPDWIELHNPTPITMELDGWKLEDSAGQWTFPDVSIAPGAYLVVFASDKDRAVAGSELHTNFKLSKEGDSLLLADPAGFVVDEVGDAETGLPRQLTDIAYGIGAGGQIGYLTTTTPGGPNSALGSDFVPVLRPFTDRLYNEGEAVDELIDGFDPDGDPLTFGMSPAPSGVTLGLLTGQLGGTTRNAGTWASIISVTDADNRVTTQDVNWFVVPPPSGNSKLVLNEYNAVSPSSELIGEPDPAFGAGVLGNGGDWFEFVVVQDRLDIRGWTIELWDRDNKDELLRNNASLTFSNSPELVSLPAGTIITISEDRPDDLSMDQAAGDWHINLQSNDADDGAYITAESQENFNSSRSNQNVIIRDAAGVNVSPVVGETEVWDNLVGGVGSGEVMSLCINPAQVHVDPVGDYLDNALSSSFGQPNTCTLPGPDPLIPDDDIIFDQDLTALRDSAAELETVETQGITIAVSCLAGNGRIDTNIVNTGSSLADYRIEFEGLTPRQSSVLAGDWWRMPITGRPDRSYSHVVLRNGVVVSDTTITVSCDTDPPQLPTPEVQVINACRAGNGYVLFQFVNERAAARGYVIEFDGVANRSTTAAGYGAAVRAVTGRPNGDYEVLIREGAVPVANFMVNVDCG